VETFERDLKLLVDELRQEWKLMWRSRIDDKVRAEGIADKTYERLFVERGLILLATRNFSPPDFQDILRRHLTPEEAERVQPDPNRGGIRKFIREYITIQDKVRSRLKEELRAQLEQMKQHGQPKHGGRGWLHMSMVRS